MSLLEYLRHWRKAYGHDHCDDHDWGDDLTTPCTRCDEGDGCLAVLCVASLEDWTTCYSRHSDVSKMAIKEFGERFLLFTA